MSHSNSDWKAKVAAAKEEKGQVKLQKKAAANANVAARATTTGWRTSGNAYLFKLKVNDPIVAYYLPKAGLTLKRSQSSDSFDFELHPGHTTGNPIYIRMADNTDDSLMTKFDTKNIKTPPALPIKKDMSDGGFANFNKVTLSSTEKSSLHELIRDNWAFLQFLGTRIYEEDGVL